MSDAHATLPSVLTEIAEKLGVTLSVPRVLPGKSATFANIADVGGVCPLCAQKREEERGMWSYPLPELPQGGASVRFRDLHLVCSNAGCPACGGDGLAPEDWVTRLGGNWETYAETWEANMRRDGAVYDLATGKLAVVPSFPAIDPRENWRALPLSRDKVLNPVRDTFVLGKMIPYGKTSVFFGPSAVGKSTLMSQVIFSRAIGLSSLWGLPLESKTGVSLVVSLEDTYDDWHLKLAAFCRAHHADIDQILNRVYVIAIPQGFTRLSEIVIRQERDSSGTRTRHIPEATAAREWLLEETLRIGADFVYVETASRLVEKEDNENFSALQSDLGYIAHETGAAVTVSHHATKKSVEENDSSITSARGGGALICNTRNALVLFPAPKAVTAPLLDRFEESSVAVLGHVKSTSSTKRQPDTLLVLRDPGGDLGGVFLTPDEILVTPAEREEGAKRVAAYKASEGARMTNLCRAIDAVIATGKAYATFRDLKDRIKDIGVGQRDLNNLIARALDQGFIQNTNLREKDKALHLICAPAIDLE